MRLSSVSSHLCRFQWVSLLLKNCHRSTKKRLVGFPTLYLSISSQSEQRHLFHFPSGLKRVEPVIFHELWLAIQEMKFCPQLDEIMACKWPVVLSESMAPGEMQKRFGNIQDVHWRIIVQNLKASWKRMNWYWTLWQLGMWLAVTNWGILWIKEQPQGKRCQVSSSIWDEIHWNPWHRVVYFTSKLSWRIYVQSLLIQ